jgi:tetratricopeptide (TPR) repeat protein
MKYTIQLRHKPDRADTPSVRATPARSDESRYSQQLDSPDEGTGIAAMLVFGTSPSVWLSAVCEWKLRVSQLRFLPLTAASYSAKLNQSSDDTDVAPPVSHVFAALVAGEEVGRNAERIRAHRVNSAVADCLPPLFYYCFADRIFLPKEAEMFPAINRAELTPLLPAESDHLLVWHPSAGLIEYESDQILSAADLLTGPVVTTHQWDAGQYGDVLNDQILSLNTVATLQDLLDVIQSGQDDIGQNANDIGNVPPAPDEVNLSVFTRMRHAVRHLAGRIVFQITDRLPESPTGSNFLGRLHQWAQNLVSGSNADGGRDRSGARGTSSNHRLTLQRENEMKRLLHLLEKNPDHGLRYAIPLFGDASRGIAPPTGRLGERNPDFDFSRLNRSGKGDVWNLPEEYRIRLTLRYRELAQREARLGNHRRAAYIYATLLNEMHAAAAVLEAGRFYWDAAAIYQTKLLQPLKAAECLKAGGMWEEAVPIFRQHQRWMDAAQLYSLLKQPEVAREMYNKELQARILQRQFSEAAAIAKEHLLDIEQAVQLLRQGWKNNCQAEDCLRELLQLLGDSGQHQTAESVLEELTSSEFSSPQQQVDAVTVCSESVTGYPDKRVQEVARRQVWLLAAAVLSSSSESDSAGALEAIRGMADNDELLRRDTTRFQLSLRTRSLRSKRGEKSKVPGRAQRAAVVGTILRSGGLLLQAKGMPKGMRWSSAVTSSTHVFCLGLAHDTVVVGKWMLGDTTKKVAIPEGEIAVLHPIFTENVRRWQLLVNPLASDRVFLQKLPTSRQWNDAMQNYIMGQPYSFIDVISPHPGILLDLQILPSGFIWVLIASEDDGRFRLDVFSPQGDARRSFQLNGINVNLSETDLAYSRLQIDGRRALIFAGGRICRTEIPAVEFLDKRPEPSLQCHLLLELDSYCQGIACSPSYLTPRVAIGMDEGISVVWPVTGEFCKLASNLQQPLVAFTANGLFVAICRRSGRIECYRLGNGKAELVYDRDVTHAVGKPVDVMPGRTAGEFMVLFESGSLHQMLIPIR